MNVHTPFDLSRLLLKRGLLAEDAEVEQLLAERARPVYSKTRLNLLAQRRSEKDQQSAQGRHAAEEGYSYCPPYCSDADLEMP